MPLLTDYANFGHIHWETGSLAAALEYEGAKISEALLFGISGGIVAGYLSSSSSQRLHVLTRNPFQPMETIIKRLALPVDDQRTSNPEKAERYLREALEAGHPTIVWADISELPYTDISPDEGMLPRPILVYGYDSAAYIADRAQVPLMVTPSQLAKARAALEEESHRMLTVAPPHESRLALAVRLGIESCVRNFTEEAPMKALRGKFGLEAYQTWARLLVQEDEQGWAQRYADSQSFFRVLSSAYESINWYATGGCGSRSLFADFLEDASRILGNNALYENAKSWRSTLPLWEKLNNALLPKEHEPLAKARKALDDLHQSFLDEGADSLKKRRKLRRQVVEELNRDYPLFAQEMADIRENLRDAVLKLHEAEAQAVNALRETSFIEGAGR
jgi:hypothetical protein